MSNNKEETQKEDATKSTGKTLSLSGKTLSLKGGASARSKTRTGGPASVAVEVRRKRLSPAEKKKEQEDSEVETHLTLDEKETRERALQAALAGKSKKKALPKRRVMTIEDKKAEEELLQASKKLEEKKKEQEATTVKKEKETDKEDNAEEIIPQMSPEDALLAQKESTKRSKAFTSKDANSEADGELSYRDKIKKAVSKAPRKSNADRRGGRITITQALNKDYERDRGPSLAAQKRAREKARIAAQPFHEPTQKSVREVVLPETITVQELSNRMAEPGKDVIKALMKMGVMATST
ncbi:MAG: translation initiation factor IF-2 N-terminal domain-containing protein, partial [Alphaproteobacteria bacterium]|nr:translation initiation factor IF-2 N-terminal domain-containing protein [Alphaproteobacteria bacterium]